MSFGSLEVASIPRTQDYTTMKQNEDNKGAFQQMTLGEHAQKQSEQRTRAMFEARKAAVEDEMKQLEKTLDMLKFKCWYYEKAMEDGNEDGIHAMLPDNLPPEIQPIYDNSHDR